MTSERVGEPEEVSAGRAGEERTGVEEGGRPARSREVAAESRKVRQAVVVIHGVGEQRPMDTLRGFVEAVLDPDPRSKRKYRSKPDAMNELLETRCLQAPRNQGAGRPLTDFYEYYWARHMEGSTYGHVLGWAWELLRRRPSSVPGALRPAYYAIWFLLAAALAFALGIVDLSLFRFIPIPAWSTGLLTGLSGLASLVLPILLKKVVLGVVADAARYLSPTPGNIAARNTIRAEGLKLLRALHASGKYTRIVIVGHSLGSVIGYDIIRNLWTDLRKPDPPNPGKQPELKGFGKEAEKVNADPGPAGVEAYRQAQHRLWAENVGVGVPWLVTDFVTLGAPLAHGQLLMARTPEEFAATKEQYEYPCCPPVLDEPLAYEQHYDIGTEQGPIRRSVRLLHHGAPFAPTRWTNIYFPYHRLIFGDMIGGPLGPVFGRGVRDVAATPADGFLSRTVCCHTQYWDEGGAGGTPKSGTSALKALGVALGLDFLKGKHSREGSGTASPEHGKANGGSLSAVP